MSIQAMTWAYACFKVDDPIETIVLITLANYADDFGVCWPSQATLARDCRCKIRKLQYSLKALEKRGLIARHARRRANGSRRSDVFVLIGFEGRERAASLDDHPVLAELNRATADASETTNPHVVQADRTHDMQAAKAHVVQGGPAPDAPCDTAFAQDVACPAAPAPISLHHVQLGKAHVVQGHPACGAPLEPSIEPSVTTTSQPPSAELEARCLEVAGPGLCEASRSAIPSTRHVIDAWLEEGVDLERDVLPTIRDRTARDRATPIRTWDYFTEAVREARRRRLSRAAAAPSAGEAVPEAAGDPPDPAERLAGWINSGMFVPSSAVSNTMRDELLRRGLVTEAALRRLQVH